jgi:hypothetical protein
MARKYEIGLGRYAWNLEQCEEEILIAAYDEIYRFIPPQATWKDSFENHFFDHGNGISFEFIDRINAVRRRRGFEEIAFRETDIFDYGRSLDKASKANRRRQVREELKIMSEEAWQRRIEHARAEAESLPSPHMTCEQFKARREERKAGSSLTIQEMVNRAVASQAASNAPIQSPPNRQTLPPERAAKMLALASPSIRGEIIQNLSAEDALVVAEKIEDTELRDALVRHCLGAPGSPKSDRSPAR